MQTPLELITDLVVQMTGVERARVQPDSRLIDFGIDSARAMDVVVALEEAYEVEIRDQDLAALKTLADVAAYVDRRRGA